MPPSTIPNVCQRLLHLSHAVNRMFNQAQSGQLILCFCHVGTDSSPGGSLLSGS